MRNKWFRNLPQMCQFLNKWKSERAEAHPSQTSQKSLAWEFHLAVCSDSPSDASLFPPCFTLSSQLVSCSPIPPCSPTERRIITIIPITFAFTLFLLAQAKKEKKKKPYDLYECWRGTNMRKNHIMCARWPHTTLGNTLTLWEFVHRRLTSGG